MIKSAIIYLLSDLCIDKLFGGLFQATKTLALLDLSSLINKQYDSIVCDLDARFTGFYWSTLSSSSSSSSFNSIYHLNKAKLTAVDGNALEVKCKGMLIEVKVHNPIFADIYYRVCSKNDKKYPIDSVTRKGDVIYIYSSRAYRLFVDRSNIISPQELK